MQERLLPSAKSSAMARVKATYSLFYGLDLPLILANQNYNTDFTYNFFITIYFSLDVFFFSLRSQ